MKISWHCKHFTELTTAELYAIIQLRVNVFVVEQNCPYPELDDKDQEAFHVYGIDETGETVAVSRILKPCVSYDEASIGRVASAKSARLTGAGMQLMKETLERIEKLFGKVPVRISAQEYLKNFYEKFSFTKVSDSYLEDDIPHIEMLREVHS